MYGITYQLIVCMLAVLICTKTLIEEHLVRAGYTCLRIIHENSR